MKPPQIHLQPPTSLNSHLPPGAQTATPWSEPLRADAAWLGNLPNATNSVLTWAGGNEVLVDSIKEISTLIASVHPHTKLIVGNGAGHVEVIVNSLLSSGEDEGTSAIRSELSERLG